MGCSFDRGGFGSDHSVGLITVWNGGVSLLAVGGYLALFGIGSGAFAVARATMPLVFYSKADYAVVLSATALPLTW